MQSSTSSRILFIVYEYPPSAGGGGQRITKFTRYLTAAGWSLHVLTAELVPGRPTDNSLLAEVAGVPVTKLPARHVAAAIARMLKPLRFARPMVAGTVAAGASAGSGVSGGQRPLSSRISRWLAVPDDALFWSKRVPAVAKRLHAEHGFSAILASGPPYSTLVAAVRAGRELGLPVVVDMRDPWVGNLHAKWPTAWHQRRFAELEREVMTAAAGVTAVSDVIAEECIEMGASGAIVIPNGFDPTDMPRWAPVEDAPLKLAFLGQFSPRLSDPSDIFVALARAREIEPRLQHATIDVLGAESPWAIEAAEQAGVADAVTFHGFKPYAEALAAVSSADAGLLILPDGPGSAGVYSGKLFDYLGMGIPVLLYGPAKGAAGKLVAGANAGLVVPFGDVDAMVRTLCELAVAKAEHRAVTAPDADVLAPFDRTKQVATLSAEIERVVRGADAR
jgi:glycosyltransferase involved in cell wall biosynthesis